MPYRSALLSSGPATCAQERPASVVITGGAVLDNWAGTSAGGLSFDNLDSVSLTGVLFRANAAFGGNGGAVAGSSLGDVAIAGCAFEQNEASGDGGAAYLVQSSRPIRVSATNFTRNSASEAGGALAVVGAQSLVAEGVNFSGNAALGPAAAGGALAAVNVRGIDCTRCEWAGNVATLQQVPAEARAAGLSRLVVVPTSSIIAALGVKEGSGGAVVVAAATRSELRCARCRFDTNAADGNGGALAIAGAVSAQLDSATFTANLATARGGAAAVLGPSSELVLTAVNASGNAATGVRLSTGLAAPIVSRAAVCGPAAAAGAAAVNPTTGATASLCTASGGFLAVLGRGASASVLGAGSRVDGSSAAWSGAAFHLEGEARLAVSEVTVRNASAYFGGLLGFCAGAERLANVSLSALSYSGVSAFAGALFALADGASEFSPPECANCTQLQPPPSARSYGATAATLPADVQVAVPASTFTGSFFTVRMTLFDGFNQTVTSYPGAVGILGLVCNDHVGGSGANGTGSDISDAEAVARAITGDVGRALCDVDSTELRGATTKPFADGEAVMEGVEIHGYPGTAVRVVAAMHATAAAPSVGAKDAGGSPPALLVPLHVVHGAISIAVEPCGPHQVFEENTKSCDCTPGAAPGPGVVPRFCSCLRDYTSDGGGACVLAERAGALGPRQTAAVTVSVVGAFCLFAAAGALSWRRLVGPTFRKRVKLIPEHALIFFRAPPVPASSGGAAVDLEEFFASSLGLETNSFDPDGGKHRSGAAAVAAALPEQYCQLEEVTYRDVQVAVYPVMLTRIFPGGEARGAVVPIGAPGGGGAAGGRIPPPASLLTRGSAASFGDAVRNQWEACAPCDCYSSLH